MLLFLALFLSSVILCVSRTAKIGILLMVAVQFCMLDVINVNFINWVDQIDQEHLCSASMMIMFCSFGSNPTIAPSLKHQF